MEREVGITVSVGLSYCKFLAKIASDLDKPRGFSVIGRGEAVAFLADKPVRILPGVGKAAEERLAAKGVRQIGDLRRLDLRELHVALGKEGPRLLQLANGIDDRRVEPERETKSVSSETTFETDISALEDLEPVLWRMAEKTAIRLRKEGLSGRGVTLKLKTADFRLLTRSRQLPEPTQLARRLYDAAHELLQAEPRGVRYRLIGVGADHLGDADQADRGDLADPSPPRQAAVEKAMDRLRAKFGGDAVKTGIGLGRVPLTSGRESAPSRPAARDRRSGGNRDNPE